MRRVLVTVLLILLLAGSVSAAKVSYYPSKKDFQSFLESNETYRVIPGRDPWSRGWAVYIDTKLSLIKNHGTDTLVLVGNVYTNEIMAKLWNQTGLDPSFSLSPSVIVLNHTIMITGSEKNLYLTYEAFSSISYWTSKRIALFLVILGLYVILMFFALRRDGSYAGSIFLLGMALIGEWALLRYHPPLLFERTIYLSLARMNSASCTAATAYILRILPPIDELLWAVKWMLISLLLGISMYVAPKHERSLGVVAFLLALSSPTFREWLLFSDCILGIISLGVVFALASNSSINRLIGRGLVVILMAIFTVAGALINPYLAILPVIFALLSPKKIGEGLGYLVLSMLGLGFIYYTIGTFACFHMYLNPPNVGIFKSLLRETLIQIGAIIYSGLLMMKSRKVRKRGPTAFIGAVAILFLVLSPFKSDLFPYSVFSLSVLTPRVLRTIPQT